MRKQVIELNGRDKLSLPIVKFPPFNLRAAMVEKDPVIWLHLLEVYVKYLNYITYQDNLDFLDDQTLDYLRVFIRSYLHEMSGEEGKLLSLGANHDVLRQLQLLRAYVFNLIKQCGLLFLQISTKEVWDMVRVFSKGNLSTIQNLLNGTLRPSINTHKAQINWTVQIQQHIMHLIESNQFSRVDLLALETLLEPTSKVGKQFADEFVSTKWMESLESMFGKEPGSYLSEWGRKLGVLSILCCSTDNIRNLLKQMHVENLKALSLHPLLGSILIDPNFQRRNPEIKSIPFLNVATNSETVKVANLTDLPTEEEISNLQEMLPHFTHDELFHLLTHYNRDLEAILNDYLENPTILDSIITKSKGCAKLDDSKTITPTTVKQKDTQTALSPSDLLVRQDPTVELSEIPDQLRNRNLARALALLYDENDDERDDTYDDAEVKQTTSERVNIGVGGQYEKIEEEQNEDRVEGYLWELLKKDKTYFNRQARKSKVRKEMRAITNWTDEQIEGWSRMIEKSPKRAQLLEQKYIFRGNIRSGKTSYVKNKNEAEANVDVDQIPVNYRQDKNTEAKKNDTRKDGRTNNKKRNTSNMKKKATKSNNDMKNAHSKNVSRVYQ